MAPKPPDSAIRSSASRSTDSSNEIDRFWVAIALMLPR